tara:strand:- start:536 stop:880 length:345 start_codon:yes stop_codon:yes gene_type:complete
MAIRYFQDTIFQTDSALSAIGVGTALQVAVNNTFNTKDYTLVATVASINTNVKVSLEGSIDGTNYGEIISEKTITENGTFIYSVANTPVRWLRPRFISETGGTAATVVFSIAAS